MAMMGMSFSQTMRQELRQTLTPQQRQLVDVLELPDVSVEGYLEEMLTSNPALTRSLDVGSSREVRKAFVRKGREDDLPPIEARLSASSDLMEHLLAQFRLERTTDAEAACGMMILGNLDAHGFLAMPLEDIAHETRLRVPGITLADAEGAQIVILQLEPMGCGANDLVHYLTFMATQQWPDDPFFPELIEHHLDDLQKGKFKKVAKDMDLDPEDVEEYHRMLVEEVAPYPARGFSDADPDFVRPCMDVYRCPESHRWKVRMHDPPRAQVRLDPAFEAKIRALPDGPEKREALEKLEQARWVVRSLEERHSLVKQVAELAVKGQEAFFDHGAVHLKNLTMAEVAEQLGRDTSTVSRAVMGRWFQWEHGTMALRDLFVNRGGGQETSEALLHAAIQQIVDAEDKRDPMSDDAIALELKKRGMTGVARRTVAKHRERVGIPSSRDRRAR
jgi:RNA polymerase sigma-54 factor